MYISRESIVLTVIGIVFGYLLGNLLTAYILDQAENAEAVVFPRTIEHCRTHLTATLLMLAFTGIVTWLTHRRLQRVDMVEALKLNEGNLQFRQAASSRRCFFHTKFIKNWD